MAKVVWIAETLDEIVTTAPTKRAVVEFLRKRHLASKANVQTRRVCRTCYEVRLKCDLTGEWSRRYTVKTQLKEAPAHA